MKKRTIFIIMISFVGLVFLGGFYFSYYFKPRNIETIDLDPLDNKKITLSTKDYIEDFNFAYDTLKTYYPYFKINKKINKIDWLKNKEKYKNYISKSKTDEDFYKRMMKVLAKLNNGHTHLVEKDFGMYVYLTYYSIPRYNWRSDIAKIYEKDRVRKRYNITNQSIKKYLESYYSGFSNTNNSPSFDFENKNFSRIRSLANTNPSSTENLLTGKLIDKKLAYMKIQRMLGPDQIMEDRIILDSFLDEIKDYPNLIIDIRSNFGGDSRYWQKYLLPKIIGKSYKTTYYNFLKKGNLFNKIILQEDYHANIKEFLENSSFSKEIKSFLYDFDFYNNEELIVDPAPNSINYKGNIYLLVDENVYSAAEGFASFAKETSLAKLVGKKTGGDGIGSDPMQVDLPNTGFVLRFSKNMGLTQSGLINELDRTTPDIEVESSLFDENLLDQRAIQEVMKDAGLL